MKKSLSFLLLILVSNSLLGQDVFIKYNKIDTVFINKKPSFIFEEYKPHRYLLKTFDEKSLIEVHSAYRNIASQPGYLMTFSNDKKQAMLMVKSKRYKTEIINEIVKNRLIENGMKVSEEFELNYVSTHKLPKDFEDLDGLVEY
jgi:hypothetical protein